MYELSNLNHHENKIKVLLKYILFFLDMRKMSGCVVTCLKLQPWSCSEQVRADSEQKLQEAAGAGSNEMFSWWVGDLYVGANLVAGMNLE